MRNYAKSEMRRRELQSASQHRLRDELVEDLLDVLNNSKSNLNDVSLAMRILQLMKDDGIKIHHDKTGWCCLKYDSNMEKTV